MSFITAIGIANPANRFPQSKIAEFMLRAMRLNQNGDGRKLRAVFRSSGIDYRYSVLEDYGRVDNFTFFADNEDLEPFPGTQKRLDVFREHAVGVSTAAVQNLSATHPRPALDGVTHLVVVCCTGMYAPGLDIDLVHALGLNRSVERTAINFMGCHAAFNALKVAAAFCERDAHARVLIVCTELCSLHFQRAPSDDNILANALFGDGSAAVLVESEPTGAMALKIETFHSDLAPDGMEDMAWTIGDAGFEMKLSSYVPDLIRAGIRELVQTLLHKAQVDFSAVRHFAIHPGGRRILQTIEQELNLPASANACAYHVLRQYGNMSSATVLFVLHEQLRRLQADACGDQLLAMAFGPGLTLESMMVRIEKIGAYA